jgi:hypothetical protein
MHLASFARSSTAVSAVRPDAVCCYRNDLTRFHVPDKFSSYGVKRAGFRRKDIGAVPFADAKRLEAEGITHADQLSRRHDDKGVRALYLSGSPADRLFDRSADNTLPRDMVGDDLRVDRRLKDGAVDRQIVPQLFCIDQISVMSKRQRSLI